MARLVLLSFLIGVAAAHGVDVKVGTAAEGEDDQVSLLQQAAQPRRSAPAVKSAVAEKGRLGAGLPWLKLTRGFLPASQLYLPIATDEAGKALCAPVRKYFTGKLITAEFCGGTDAIGNASITTPWIKGTPREADMDRPMKTVLEEHGNLYYYFGNLNQEINVQAEMSRSFPYAMRRQGFLNEGLISQAEGPRVTYKWDGGELSTVLNNCMAADEPYCYSNGWLKGQELSQKHDMEGIFQDFQAFNVFGAEECRKIREEYAFNEDEITLNQHLWEINDMYVKQERTCDWHEPDPGPKVTVRDYKKHAYGHCWLHNLTNDIMYCYFRGCVLPGTNRIGHGSECGY